MSKLEYQGPFLGFTFCGVHSSDLSIVRINSSNRANLNLTPTFVDSTVDRVGNDGTFYLDSHSQSQIFDIDFAYDELTETEVRKLTDFFNSKKVGILVFDETPYKQYYAKVTTQPKMSYIAFDKVYDRPPKLTSKEQLYGQYRYTHVDRVYKGEGTVSFTAFDPYAFSPYHTFDEFEDDYIGLGYINFEEWIGASGLLTKEEQKDYDNDFETGGETKIYNGGNVSTPFNFKFKINGGQGYIGFHIKKDDEVIQSLYVDSSKLESDVEYFVDSKHRIILDENNTVVSYAIVCGDFFEVPPSIKNVDNYVFTVETNLSLSVYDIDYKYRYL